jgi:hypothetical protein
MSRFAEIVIVLVFAALICSGCGDDSNPVNDDLSLAFLGHDNAGCSGTRDSSRYGCMGTAFLKGVEVEGDTLTLDIHFEANCCPEFYENVSFRDGRLELVVVDSAYGCRCICPFENQFSFLFGGHGDLEIDFLSTALPDSLCVSAFDTVVTLPK